MGQHALTDREPATVYMRKHGWQKGRFVRSEAAKPGHSWPRDEVVIIIGAEDTVKSTQSS